MPKVNGPTYRSIPWVDWPSCDPTKLGKRIKDNVAYSSRWHCRRMDCPGCCLAITTLRARTLLYEVQTSGIETLWFGVVDAAAISSIQRYCNRNAGIKRLLTLYHDDVDLRTMLVDDNVLPRRRLLRAMPAEDAVIDGWYRYAVNHGLRKNPYDDWDISRNDKAEWVDDGPKADIVETDQRMDRIHGYSPGARIDDVDSYKDRFRRIRRDLTDPPEASYLDS